MKGEREEREGGGREGREKRRGEEREKGEGEGEREKDSPPILCTQFLPCACTKDHASKAYDTQMKRQQRLFNT